MQLLKDAWHITLALLKLPIKLLAKLYQKIDAIGWKRAILAGLILIVLLTVGGGTFIELTSQPQFCVSCHYMRPYFSSWETSSHKDVSCTKCHFPPGIQHTIEGKFTALSMLVNYTTGIYKRSKPWAEISDASCLRGGCHETRVLEGRVEYLQGIIFDHKPHLTELRLGKKLRCTSCHSQIVQGEHISVTPSTCFICHFKGDDKHVLSQCTTCHDAPVRSAIKPDVSFDHKQMLERGVTCNRCHGTMQVGSGDVPKDRCNSCHAELGKIERFNDTQFIHNAHITDRKVDCQACHQEILHKSVSRTELVKPACEDCHQNFHDVQVNLFTGTGGIGTEEQPSTMFESGLNCRGCHILKESNGGMTMGGTTLQASGVVCTPCHDPGYDKILDGWKRRNSERVNQIQSVALRVGTAVRGISGVKRSEADSLVNAARHNMAMVDLGHGIHNIPFSESLLGTAYGQLSKAADLAGGVRLPVFEFGLPKHGAECMNCHYGVETMVVQRQNQSFPHAEHVLKQKLACTKCHSNEVKHGELILTQAACNECHHKPTDGNPPVCSSCHSLQSTIYSGDKVWGTEAFPDAMFEGGLSCQDCHIDAAGGVIRPKGETCVACHEPGYDKILEGWKQDFQTEIKTIDSLLHICRNIDLQGLNEIRMRIEDIRRDNSGGVHNHALLEDIMKKDAEWLGKFISEHGLDLAKPTVAQ